MAFHVPHRHRIRTHPKLGSDDSFGNNGAFEIPHAGVVLFVIASDGADLEAPNQWEHVSVHAREGDRQRTPTWDEMCAIKALFWDAEDCVIQFHPPRSQYVNRHQHCLHLWRSLNYRQAMPPKVLVG